MNRKPFLKSLSEGRGNCPLPSRTHPQKLNLAIYTEELTHLIRITVTDWSCFPMVVEISL